MLSLGVIEDFHNAGRDAIGDDPDFLRSMDILKQIVKLASTLGNRFASISVSILTATNMLACGPKEADEITTLFIKLVTASIKARKQEFKGGE